MTREMAPAAACPVMAALVAAIHVFSFRERRQEDVDGGHGGPP